MHLQRIRGEGEEYFDQAFSLCESAFVYEERRDIAELRRVMKNEDYHFCVLVDENAFCGIVLYELIFFEHFAISEKLRNCGLGARALDLLKAKGKPIILEIEPPIDELTQRRRGFYLRNGFVECECEHIQAKLHIGDPDVPLKILSYPEVISREEYDRFYAYMLENISARA